MYAIIFIVTIFLIYAFGLIGIGERSEDDKNFVAKFGIVLALASLGLLLGVLSMIRVLHFNEIDDVLVYKTLLSVKKRTILVSKIKKVVLINVEFGEVSKEIIILDEETEQIFNEQLIVAKTGKKVKLNRNIPVLSLKDDQFIKNFWAWGIQDETEKGLFKVYR
jgi:hypothetical protein